MSVQQIAISTSCHSNLHCPRTYAEVDVKIEMPTGFAELQVLMYLLGNRISDLATYTAYCRLGAGFPIWIPYAGQAHR